MVRLLVPQLVTSLLMTRLNAAGMLDSARSTSPLSQYSTGETTPAASKAVSTVATFPVEML